MTQSSDTGKTSILRANPSLATQIGRYSYRMEHSVYIVSDGQDQLSFPIHWALGRGTIGQTWLFEREGRWYESRVSYFSALQGLDITIGQQALTPHNLSEAAGRLLGPDELGKCLGCHATNVTRSPHLELSAMIPGVQCERCHGPTEAHRKSNAPMRRLGALTAEEMSNFCGQCHRTWSEISISGPRGVQNVRFQPYRLTNSRCYDASDNRIRCTACHDPHRPIETMPSFYDARCQACHSVRPCRVGSENCVNCHMPKIDLPGAHKRFTDHRIRVVKANEPYPD